MFAENLNSGIDYYNELFTSLNDRFNDTKSDILKELERSRQAIHLLRLKIENQAIKVVS